VHGKGNKQRLVFNLLNNPYINKKARASPQVKWKKISRIAI
jgi:hypothetical protein